MINLNMDHNIVVLQCDGVTPLTCQNPIGLLNLPADAFKEIMSHLSLFSLLAMQFTSIKCRQVTRKKFRRRMFRFMKRKYQREISNDVVCHGIVPLKWLTTISKTWTPPDYCYAQDVPTLQWIKDRNLAMPKRYRNRAYNDQICPPKEVLNWLVESGIYDFSQEKVAKMGYYDILEKCKPRQGWIPSYHVLCWEISTGRKLSYGGREKESVIIALVGGGKRYIEGITFSTDGSVDTSDFVCQNTGSVHLSWALDNGYKISPSSFVSAVEANNIEALRFLKWYDPYSRLDLVLADESNPPCDDYYIRSRPYYNDDSGCPEYLLDVAIEEDHYDAVRWVIENYKISRQRHLLCSNLEILHYLKSRGFIWDASTYTIAIRDHNLKTIQYLHSQGVPWTKDQSLVRYGTSKNLQMSICCYLAQAGNIEIMKWCLDHGLSLDHRCINHANNLQMIQYLMSLELHPGGGTWESCMGNLKAIKWLARCGFKIPDYSVNVCRCYGSPDVVRWVEKHRNDIIQRDEEGTSDGLNTTEMEVIPLWLNWTNIIQRDEEGTSDGLNTTEMEVIPLWRN
ncbi:Hypothetical protein POVR1_LOCUS296 [uncultured virus]|nr:Hypothetical protein POVR1_LOCUS296 [uncultured virus]